MIIAKEIASCGKEFKDATKRPSASFAMLYRFVSFLDIRSKFAPYLDSKGLKCLTINLLRRLITILYWRDSYSEGPLTVYAECCLSDPFQRVVPLIPCDADHSRPISTYTDKYINPIINIYLTNIELKLNNIIDRLEKEMGVSRNAASALVESIIVAHEVHHCMTNLALVFMSYYLNKDVDFVDTLCAEFLSEKIVDYSLMKLLPQVLESLGINPALTKSFPVLELLESFKVDNNAILSNLKLLAEYITSNLDDFDKIIHKVKDPYVRSVLYAIYERVKGMKDLSEQVVHMLFVMLGRKSALVRRIVRVLRNDVEEFRNFVLSYDSSYHRLLDKVCTALDVNTPKILYLWDKGYFNDLVELLLDLGILKKAEVDYPIADSYAYLKPSPKLDVSAFNEFKKIKLTRVVPDLRAYMERIVLASSATGFVKTSYWDLDPKDPFNASLTNDVRVFTKVKEKKKVKMALIVDNPVDEALDHGVVREIVRRLRSLSVKVNKVKGEPTRAPFSPYVFYITATWKGAEEMPLRLYRMWGKSIALAVLMAYPDAPFPPPKVLRMWKSVSRYLYFVSLYDFDDLSKSRVYPYKLAYALSERGQA